MRRPSPPGSRLRAEAARRAPGRRARRRREEGRPAREKRGWCLGLSGDAASALPPWGWGGSRGSGAETPSPELAGAGSVSRCGPGLRGRGGELLRVVWLLTVKTPERKETLGLQVESLYVVKAVLRLGTTIFNSRSISQEGRVFAVSGSSGCWASPGQGLLGKLVWSWTRTF